VALAWSSSTGAASYSIYRATNPGLFLQLLVNVTSTAYTDTAVTNGATYYYSVYALNGGGFSPPGQTLRVTPAAPPSPPTLTSAISGNTQVTLAWTAGAGINKIPSSYSVEYGTVSGTYGAPVNVGNVNSYTINNLTNGTTYYFAVTATNAGGTSGNSNQLSTAPNGSLPTVPVITAAAAGNAQVALTWTTSTGALSYNVGRSTVNGGPYTTIANPTTAAYTDTSVTNGTTYYYVVAAVNASGTSANSAQASATPEFPVPPTPTNLMATAGNAQVALTWSASTGATNYNVFRSTSSGGSFPFLANVTSPAYTDTAVTNGTTYYYVVSALNASGQSAVGQAVAATPEP
jgi:fibronectin type 3 domain-containing protein